MVQSHHYLICFSNLRTLVKIKNLILSLICKQKYLQLLSLSTYDKFSDYCVQMAEADDTWKFRNIFTDNIMLPYLLLWYGMRFTNWNFRVAAIKLIAPISHALDRTSYLRILPRHIADIRCLPINITSFSNGRCS